ncbi:MAG: tripartite tricarboxylate transporter substrate-binding protein [Candidatus Malihini olakiniferum]
MFVSVNKPAGNGITTLIEVDRAKPDDYKLVMTTVELAMFLHQNKSLVKYKNFTPLVTTIADPVAIVVRANAGFDTLQAFIDSTKQKPGKPNVGNSSMGGFTILLL